MFASEPSSPRRDPEDIQDPSSPTRSAPSAPSDAPAVYPRAPPRVVHSLHGQVLVDREGHVPRALPRVEKDAAEEEEGEDKVQWPPTRDGAAKEQRTSEPDVEVEVHHAFSQPLPPPWPEVPQETAEPGKRQRLIDRLPLDRRAVAALFSGQVPQVENERRENGASPVKRVVTTTPPSDPFTRQVPESLFKAFKFPAPRASTGSPFRPEPPTEETRHPSPQPRSRPPSRTKATRHPALSRIRRQTIGHGSGNAHGQVPSVDLVALSHSSMSARSNSHSSVGASGPARPSRWSLPAFTAAPWVFGEPEGTSFASESALGSGLGSSAVRWTASSPTYGDTWHRRTRTSTPRFLWTPSPARSIPSAPISVHDPRAHGTATSSPVSFTPHAPDVHLTASHGLASILAHMSANHGLALGVVEAVYKRVGSLKEADEVLKGMREAAEGFGEREIERRGRARRGKGDATGSGSGSGKTELRYVVASEDGEGSEYSPPETSRAALWKRQSESARYGQEAKERDEDAEVDEAEAEAEGRAVEEELRDSEEHEDEPQHDVSRRGEDVTSQDEDQGPQEDTWEEHRVREALLEDMRLAHELERDVGKGQYRRVIARLFA